MNFFTKTFLLFLLCGTFQTYAQKLEAENAILAGRATKQACGSCSGGFQVGQGDGNLTFTLPLAKEGYYNIFIKAQSTGGNKINQFYIAGNTMDFAISQAAYTTLKLVGGQKLAAGNQQIKILKSWGWINIDYIEFVEISAISRFNLTQTLATPNPLPEAKALCDFLLDNYGDKIISNGMTLNSTANSTWL